VQHLGSHARARALPGQPCLRVARMLQFVRPVRESRRDERVNDGEDEYRCRDSIEWLDLHAPHQHLENRIGNLIGIRGKRQREVCRR
jgi:hypothetical protein